MQELQEKGSSFIDVQFMEEAMNQLSEVGIIIIISETITSTSTNTNIEIYICLPLHLLYSTI